MGKRGPRPIPIADRFWTKVQKTETCWLWTSRLSTKGYGAIGAGGAGNGWLKAHRVAWELTHGPIPDGLKVLHRCDNPACVRPDHLFLGTLKDNTQDMLTKGRHRLDPVVGEAHYSARLTITDVRLIQAACAAGEPYAALAGRFNVTPNQIRHIALGRRWVKALAGQQTDRTQPSNP